MPFVRALRKTDLGPGQGKGVVVSGKKLALFRIGDEFFAVEDCCSHDDLPLADGVVLQDGGRCVLECPWHGSQFDLKTGAALTLPAVRPVKCYPVRVQGDDVEVEV
jgi:3-phenylpropionate/trans-cinnamate dioxygenase ferredoxin component